MLVFLQKWDSMHSSSPESTTKTNKKDSRKRQWNGSGDR